MVEIHNQAYFDDNVDAQRMEKASLEQLRQWSSIKDRILQQKFRINWVKVCDENIKFLFTAIKARYA